MSLSIWNHAPSNGGSSAVINKWVSPGADEQSSICAALPRRKLTHARLLNSPRAPTCSVYCSSIGGGRFRRRESMQGYIRPLRAWPKVIYQVCKACVRSSLVTPVTVLDVGASFTTNILLLCSSYCHSPSILYLKYTST